MNQEIADQGRKLAMEWAKARAAIDALPVSRGHSLGLTFDMVAEERNLRRELETWLWENMALVMRAIELHGK